MIVAFIALGRYLEGRAAGALLELPAKQARVIRDGAEQIIPAEALGVGDLLAVVPVAAGLVAGVHPSRGVG